MTRFVPPICRFSEHHQCYSWPPNAGDKCHICGGFQAHVKLLEEGAQKGFLAEWSVAGRGWEPIERQYYLVCDASAFPPEYAVARYEGGWRWTVIGEPYEAVTHWMCLPDRPEYT